MSESMDVDKYQNYKRARQLIEHMGLSVVNMEELSSLFSEIKRLKAELEDRNRVFNEMLDTLEGFVIPDDPLGWEYPAQVIRHIEDEIKKLRENQTLVAKENTWFIQGTAVLLLQDFRPGRDSGVFYGARKCENPASEGHTEGEIYVDEEICNFDEFEVKSTMRRKRS
jgi:hypothetical protein